MESCVRTSNPTIKCRRFQYLNQKSLEASGQRTKNYMIGGPKRIKVRRDDVIN